MNNIEIVNGIKLKKEVKSKENLKILIIDLEKNIKQKFTKIDFENILEFLDTINYNYLYKLYNMDIKQINEYIINIYKGELNKLKPIDMQEYLNDEIYDRPSKLKSEYNVKTLKTSTASVASINKSETKPSISSTPSISASASINTNNMKEILDTLPKLKTKTEQIEFTKILNYESLWRDANILVDSRYQNVANPDKSKLVFCSIKKQYKNIFFIG